MSAKSVVESMIGDAPPGSNVTLLKDIKTILGPEVSKTVVAEIVKNYHVTKAYKLVKVGQGLGLISQYTLDGAKFFDPVLKVKFDYDFDLSRVIDVEDAPSVGQLADLNDELQDYVAEHFPTFAKGVAVEENGVIHVVVVDENLNDANFYNGQWQSEYALDKLTGKLTGKIQVKVHYYEDGNVSLSTGTEVAESGVSESTLVQAIAKAEDSFERELLKRFSNLNEEQFKQLRRQLPVSRTTIQWGKAIRTYKLGQDVVDGRH